MVHISLMKTTSPLPEPVPARQAMGALSPRHVTPPSGDKKIACRHPGLAVSYKSRMAMVNYARAGVGIPTGAEVLTSSLG